MKTGEEIPMTVTIKDESGIPMANAPFTISRGYGVNRSGETKESGTNGTTDDLTLQALTPTVTTTVLANNADVYHGLTGANGSATFSLRQDTGMGLKTAISAKMGDYLGLSASLNVIFSVITSPDSAKAQYWGHMTETVTTSTGVTFHRPLLVTEAPSGNNSYKFNNENWSSVNAKNLQIADATGCNAEKQPLFSELQTLYNDNSNGALGTKYGWPVGGSDNYWWASDADPETSTFQTINLINGDKHDSTSMSIYFRQVCLDQARGTAP